MRKEVKSNLLGFYDYLKEQADKKLAEMKLPKFIRKILVGTAFEVLRGVLDLNYLITKPFTPIRYDREMKGMALGSGVSYKDIRRLNLFPELIKAACSMAGVWGNASKNGNLLQLRALDWDHNAPISQYPAITVYHSTEKGSIPYANIGYAGLIGTLTGISNASIGVVEKLWLPKADRKVKTSRVGKPWNYVLRDIMQFAPDLDGAMDQLKKAHRTCSIHVGVASSKDNAFHGVEYSYNTLNIYNDKNYSFYSEAHPQMDSVFFWD